jgi:glycosyltransferase involved in cell wall biosynthesis
MKIFLAGTSLLPEYGGPSFSLSQLAVALERAGAQIGLWASDQSAVATPLVPQASLVQRMLGSETEALNKFGEPDVLHDNGMWLWHNHRLADIADARGIPRVVSTRGMLEPWAIRHKRAKKTIAWWLYQRRDLKRAICHHTTAEREAQNIRRLGLGVPVRMVPNGVNAPEWLGTEHLNKKGQRARKTALFLGRIYPVKGLPMLVDAWARVRPEGWVLQIAGPDEAGHRAQVENAVSAANLRDTIVFLGPIGGQAKRTAFFEADLFVLPTHSESFGMVIAEALAHGLPVLTTTGAPWPMLPARGCGWRVDASVDGLAEGLRQATAHNSGTLQAMGARGRAFVTAEFGWGLVAKQFIAMYEGLIGRCSV